MHAEMAVILLVTAVVAQVSDRAIPTQRFLVGKLFPIS